MMKRWSQLKSKPTWQYARLPQETVDHGDVPDILFYRRCHPFPAIARLDLKFRVVCHPDRGAYVLTFDQNDSRHSTHNQVVNLSDATLVFDAEIVNNGVILGIAQDEIYEIRRFPFASGTGASARDFIPNKLALLGRHGRQQFFETANLCIERLLLLDDHRPFQAAFWPSIRQQFERNALMAGSRSVRRTEMPGNTI
jgi:hypothetical protein